MDFKQEIKDNIHPKLKELLDQYVEISDTLSQQSLSLEVYYRLPGGDVRHLFNRYIDLIWATYIAKFSSLMQSVIVVVNRDEFLTYGLIGRSMIEHAAILRYYHKTQIVPNLQAPIETKSVTTQILRELIEILDKHLRGGRFDWQSFLNNDFENLFSGSRSNLEQFRIGKCIKDWTEDDPSITILYGLFCDLVHPNLGSTLLTARVWSDGTGVGGSRGYPFGRDLFAKTIAGLMQVIQETTMLLDGLLLLRFPET